MGARFRLSKATGSQRFVRSLYKDLRAYLRARFRFTARAANLFWACGCYCGIVNFTSTPARSRQEAHAAMETPLHDSDPLKAARSWLWIKVVGSYRLRQGKFKISELIAQMYWGGRQRGNERRSLLRACEGELQDRGCWSKRQDLSDSGLAGNKIMGNGLSNWRQDLEAKTSLFKDLNSSWTIPLAAAILYSKQHRLLGIVLCMTLWAHGFIRQYLSLDAIFVGMFCC